MKQKMYGRVLAMVFVFCLVMVGSAYASEYMFVAIEGEDIIKVYTYDGNSLVAVIDLDDGVDDNYKIEDGDYNPIAAEINNGIISAIKVGPYQKYLYIAADKGINEDGDLYQVTIKGKSDGENDSSDLNKIIPLKKVGKRPKDIAVDDTGNIIYVANFGSDDITVIKKGETTDVGKITGLNKPFSLAVTSGAPVTLTSGDLIKGGNDLYVANYGMVDIKTKDEQGNEVTEQKYAVTFCSGTQKEHIPLDNRPTDLVASLDKQYVYVTNSPESNDNSNGLISVIRPIDYFDKEEHNGDDKINVDGEEKKVVYNLNITGAKPSRMTIIGNDDYLYAIDPVLEGLKGDGSVTGEIEDVVDIRFKTKDGSTPTLTVIDISERKKENENNQTIEANKSTQSFNNSGAIDIVGIRNSSIVFTVTGVETVVDNIEPNNSKNNICITNSVEFTPDNTLGFFEDGEGTTESVSCIEISGKLPDSINSLRAEADGNEIKLEWTDTLDTTLLGVLIYRLDVDDSTKDYKYHLLKNLTKDDPDLKREEKTLWYYDSDDVLKGKNYYYFLIPYNEIARASIANKADVRSHHETKSEICFISTGLSGASGFIPVIYLIFTGLFVVIAGRKRK